jgi:hypothetical protein
VAEAAGPHYNRISPRLYATFPFPFQRYSIQRHLKLKVYFLENSKDGKMGRISSLWFTSLFTRLCLHPAINYSIWHKFMEKQTIMFLAWFQALM